MSPATGHYGSSGIGEAAIANTMSLPSPGRWNEPFNDSYINFRRQGVRLRIPISEIVQRIAAIAKTAILGSGRRAAMRDGEVVYIVNSDF